MAGAAVALAAGVIHWHDIPVVWHIVWDATFTFIALIVISLLLDEAVLPWATLRRALGQGRGRALFPLIVVLGAAIAAVFANDGAALLLTPIVIAILTQLRLSPAAALAFIIATGFVADTTSLPLVISNLVNIVSANFFGIAFDRYAAIMVPVDLVALGATLAVLWLWCRRQVPATYPVAELPAPATAIRDPHVPGGISATGPHAGGLFPDRAVSYPGLCRSLPGRRNPVARRRVWPGDPVRKVLRGAPWQIVIFSLGMYLVVYGLRNAGLTDYLATALVWLGHQGTFTATIGTGFLAAVLSSIMNNMPRCWSGRWRSSRLTTSRR
jgi:arsenical pump membrane protein